MSKRGKSPFERAPYVPPSLKTNKHFTEIAERHGIEPTPSILAFAEDVIRLCANEAKRSQRWNDTMKLQLNIDQCILCEFDLPK